MNRQGRICIFSAFYPPHLGGVEIYTRSIALELIEMGYKACIVTSELGNEQLIDESETLTVIRIPSVPLMDGRFPLIKPGPTTKRLIHHLMEMEVSGIVVNTRYYPLSHLGLRIAKRKGIRPVLLDHSSGPISASSSITGKMIRTWENIATRYVKKMDPACYGVSRKSAIWLERLGLDAHGVIPNAINAQAFLASSSQRDFRTELSLGLDAFLIVFAGRLLAEKGVMELSEAVEAASMKRPQMHLIIAGSGPLETQLSNLKDPHIHMLGRLSSSDLGSLLTQSSLLCLPSRYPEGLPTILLEAAAAGNALVITDNGGTEEVVPSPSHGVILESGSVNHIQAALEQLYDDRDAASQLGMQAEAHVNETLTWRRSARALIDACKGHDQSLAAGTGMRS